MLRRTPGSLVGQLCQCGGFTETGALEGEHVGARVGEDKGIN